MIETVLTLIGGLKGLIIGGLGLLGGLFGLFYKARFNREREEKQKAQAANKMYQAKDAVNRQDQSKDAEVEQKIDLVRDKVDQAPNQEEAANEAGKALNDYFNSGK